MASVMVCKRVSQYAKNSTICFTNLHKFSASTSTTLLSNRVVSLDVSSMKFSPSVASSSSFRRINDYRKISQLVKPEEKPIYLVDTATLVKTLEEQGVTRKQSEEIIKVLKNSSEKLSFVSKVEMQKIVGMIQESNNLSEFKSEVCNIRYEIIAAINRLDTALVLFLASL